MKLYLIWGYTNNVVYGTPNSNKDLVHIFTNEDRARATLNNLQDTVGQKYNVTYRLEDREVSE